MRTGARAGERLELTQLAPSGRSILIGLALLLLACGSYALARGTSAFAVREVTVEGPPRHVAKQVARVLSPTRGRSLLALDLPGLRAAVQNLPAVAAVRFDRAFPHTLRVVVVPERPVAVLRQGKASWLVAASGRVITSLDRGDRKRLLRIWLKSDVEVRVGQRVAGELREAVRVVAPLVRAPLPARVASLRYGETELTLVLRSGAEVRLGDHSDRVLKLELARQILPSLQPDTRYLDVSVPERPVAGTTLNS
ncbi:MAG: FtsQ-type POTRA domain-containing protein [Actinobacteria bacterium]|nr:FtsQ-type POTRA domain-containing protein [Actinomycetota bacterium]